MEGGQLRSSNSQDQPAHVGNFSLIFPCSKHMAARKHREGRNFKVVRCSGVVLMSKRALLFPPPAMMSPHQGFTILHVLEIWTQIPLYQRSFPDSSTRAELSFLWPLQGLLSWLWPCSAQSWIQVTITGCVLNGAKVLFSPK